MSFNRIDFDELDGDLPEGVAEFISDVQEQHEDNVQFIESVIEDKDKAQDELQEYKADLAEDLSERDAVLFEADELVDFEMSRLHKLDADSAEFEASTEEVEDEGGDNEGVEGNFGRQERKSGDFTGETVDERATEGLDGMSGLVLE